MLLNYHIAYVRVKFGRSSYGSSMGKRIMTISFHSFFSLSYKAWRRQRAYIDTKDVSYLGI